MNPYVLDTDSLTLLLRGQESLCLKAAAHDPAQLAISIITVEETLTGWYSQIRRAKKDDQRIRAYDALQQAVEFCGRVRILSFDEPASAKFHDLRAAKPRIGSNDLRIAAIALVQNAIVVTRNQSDFRQV